MRVRNVVVVVVVIVVAVLLALGLWRWKRSGAAEPVVGGSAGERVAAPRTDQRLDPHTLARASIAGTVTDPKAAPIAGARVCASGSSPDLADDELAEPTCATTDARGGYAIAALLPATYTVVASAKPFRPVAYHAPAAPSPTPLPLAAGAHRTGIDLALRDGGVELVGTVSDATGGPIAGARVQAGRWDDDAAAASTIADDQGAFAMWVAPGPVAVRATADGYTDGEDVARAPGLVALVLTPEGTLAGTVIDGATNQPVEGARVIVGASEWYWEQDGQKTITDASGAFRFAHLSPGRQIIVARTAHRFGRAEGSVLVGLAQHVEGVVVKVFPAHRISGKVVIAATHEPCPDAQVSVRDTATSSSWIELRAEADGARSADGVLPGTYAVRVACPKYQPRGTPGSIVVADEDVTGLTWEVAAGATMHGKVTTTSGGVVEGAAISAQTIGGPSRARRGDADARSAADGTYALDGLTAGRYRISVVTEQGNEPKDGFLLDVAEGATITQDLVLEDTGTITGTVVDGQGTPVASVGVIAQRLDGRLRSRLGDDVLSDAAGGFTIAGLAPGAYRVGASAGRKPGPSADALGERVIVRANTAAPVRLVVETAAGKLAGKVVDHDGKPVADAYVSATRTQETRATSSSMWSAVDRPVITSVDGTFTVTGLSPGAYTLHASRKGGGEAFVHQVALGSRTTLVIAVTGSIVGKATRGGVAPRTSLEVSLSDRDHGFLRVERFFHTGGAFTFKDLPAGHFKLSVSAQDGQKQVELDLAPGETKTDVAVELDDLVTLTGRVIELGTSSPVSGMRMSAGPPEGGRSAGGADDQLDVTDEDGRFTITGARRGKLELMGFPKDRGDSAFGVLTSLFDTSGTATTFDVGDLVVIKRRLKAGEVAGELGVQFATPQRDIPREQARLEVSAIDPASPAARSALVVGDVITTVDGLDATGVNVMRAYQLMRAPPGVVITLGLARGVSVALTLQAPN